MVKVLNLDEFESTVEKSIVLDGVTHKYEPQTVEDFIDSLKQAEARDKAGDYAISDVVSYMVEMIQKAFPTIAGDRLRKLKFDKLKAISDFVNGVNEEESEGAPVPEGKKAEGESN